VLTSASAGLSAATSRWTVNTGTQALQNAWLVFEQPIDYTPAGGALVHYTPSQVGIDLLSGQWALVNIASGGTQYYYPAVRLGNVAASSSTTFEINHKLLTAIIQQGSTLRLPRYGVGLLVGVVPEPALLSLVGAALAGLMLRRRSLA
jgi:hypothetical protein